MRTLVCLVMFSIVSPLCTPMFAQSLAEVAKKEEDRRKGAKPGAKVYTNGDLRPVPAADAAPSAATAAPDSTPVPDSNASDVKAAEAKPAGAAEVKDRAYWSKRMQALRAKLDTDKVLADALQSRISALNLDFVNRDDPAQRGTIANDRDKALAELARMKAVITADEKAIPELEEEARRAGVPPGWLR